MEENKIEQNLNDLIEIVGDIKDNMVTKADLTSEVASLRSEMATKTDLTSEVASLRSEMATKIAQSEHRMKAYIDDRLADQTAEIGDRINRATGKQKDFNAELVDGIESHNLFEAERIEKLKSLSV